MGNFGLLRADFPDDFAIGRIDGGYGRRQTDNRNARPTNERGIR